MFGFWKAPVDEIASMLVRAHHRWRCRRGPGPPSCIFRWRRRRWPICSITACWRWPAAASRWRPGLVQSRQSRPSCQPSHRPNPPSRRPSCSARRRPRACSGIRVIIILAAWRRLIPAPTWAARGGGRPRPAPGAERGCRRECTGRSVVPGAGARPGEVGQAGLDRRPRRPRLLSRLHNPPARPSRRRRAVPDPVAHHRAEHRRRL